LLRVLLKKREKTEAEAPKGSEEGDHENAGRTFAARCNNKSFPRGRKMWKATAGQGPKSGHQASASYRCTEICYMCIYPLGFRGAFGADHINQPKIAHTYLPLCGTMKSRAALFLFFFAQSPLA